MSVASPLGTLTPDPAPAGGEVFAVGRARELAANSLARGSDVLAAALDGYALAKVFDKGAALDALKETMAGRFGRSRRRKPSAAAAT